MGLGESRCKSFNVNVNLSLKSFSVPAELSENLSRHSTKGKVCYGRGYFIISIAAVFKLKTRDFILRGVNNRPAV